MVDFCPKVPKQNNNSDCGIYLLQYVETFFQVQIISMLFVLVLLFFLDKPSDCFQFMADDQNHSTSAFLNQAPINMRGFQFPEPPITTRLAGKFGEVMFTRFESVQVEVVNALSDLQFHEKLLTNEQLWGLSIWIQHTV